MLVEHRGQRGDRAGRGGGGGFDAIAERQRGLERSRSQSGRRTIGVSAVPVALAATARRSAHRWR